MAAKAIRRRARSYAAFKAQPSLISKAGFGQGLNFKPRPTDIIISPFAKSGTTWLQQIVHTLRTRGDMDFDDISRVVPWIEVAADVGQALTADQRAFPRAFKSHLTWPKVPKGGRYIVSVRDPQDVLLSDYRFLEGWFFAPDAITISEFAASFMAPGPGSGYWHHLRSWWPQRFRDNVLLLTFESMKRDLPGTIAKVAQFIGIALDDELRDIALRHASFDFMKAHGDRFDDRLVRELSERRLNLPPGSDASKVRQGTVGAGRYELPADILHRLDAVWQQEIQSRLGFSDYAALAAELEWDPQR